jgi:catechol 2,3-dioxygenase-like lactoylglutathione lyase family enzyme
MANKAELIGIAPQLVVPDVKKTAEFYRDRLGFNIIGLVADPPVYAMVERDNFQVHFSRSDEHEYGINKNFRSISNDLVIWVPEIDIFFEEMTSNGVNIVEGIVKKIYGSREFVMEDCDGHRILVCD